MTVPSPRANGPAVLSLVMPCYNEEASVGFTVPKLVQGFRAAGHRLDLIAVDNGSRDRTGELLRQISREYPEVRIHRVEVNQGYGFGVICGLPLTIAPWVGIIPCDGQVDPADVVSLYEAAAATGQRVVAKVRRRFRLDGFRRKIVSVSYNLFVRLLWPNLGSIDVNGSPKIFPREILPLLRLESHGWLLDPELMIKTHYLGLRVLEYNVFARMRGAGMSHVRPSTCFEFIRTLVTARVTGRWRPVGAGRRSALTPSSADSPGP